MSGVELIVGTILGGVPVTVLAFEKYQTLSSAVSRFRNPKEVLRMQSKVGAQRTIFRNNAINLLSSLTNDRELVQSWMAELSCSSKDRSCVTPHKSFVLPEIYHDRIDSLIDTFSSCKATLDEILRIVEKISEELAGLEKALGKSIELSPGQSSGSKQWWNEMSGRLKLVFRKSDLIDAIEDLRNLNADFSVMTNQIVITLDQIKNTESRSGRDQVAARRPPKRTASNINHIEAYKRVRQASTALYDTLEKKWTCQSGKHESHAASVRCVEPEQVKEAQSITLEIALTIEEDMRNVDSNNLHHSSPMWLEVEYIDDKHHNQVTVVQTHSTQAFDELSTALNQLSTDPRLTTSPLTQAGQSSDKNTRKVRFSVIQSRPADGGGTTGQPGGPPSPNNAVATQGASDLQVHDLMLTPDFCGHIHSQYQLCKSKHYFLGYLGGKAMQRFYIPPPERRVCNEPKTLAAIIAWIGTTSMHRALPLPVALQIAGSLAASVLQFHSTPWLPETWKSEDVCFFSAGSLSIENEIQLSHPYFQVQFHKSSSNNASQHSEASDKTLADGKQGILVGVRNELLFRLGIVLLEVGFSRSWDSLRKEILASNTLHASRRTDYHIAQKLCVILQNQLGPRYSRIIRKCISCDFGLNEPQDDLEASEELQAVFLIDVIVELQRLKERVQALG
ncbi:hypothetical protein HJFPF1_08143 [Paramyrothecium foliicola]|nr:hypothetical protein HJFPF1_08143 [Paramyrothecium foliicola]